MSDIRTNGDERQTDEIWGVYDMTSRDNNGQLCSEPVYRGTKGECEAFSLGTKEDQPTYNNVYDVRLLSDVESNTR